ncbi:MAG: hypothetical protein QFC55_04195, partial [Chloroflexota bacterium]|nr:hypothetical protein [Chloroflexota bacterium]
MYRKGVERRSALRDDQQPQRFATCREGLFDRPFAGDKLLALPEPLAGVGRGRNPRTASVEAVHRPAEATIWPIEAPLLPWLVSRTLVAPRTLLELARTLVIARRAIREIAVGRPVSEIAAGRPVGEIAAGRPVGEIAAGRPVG